MKLKHTFYIAEEKLIVTELSGDLDDRDVEDWHISLTKVLSVLPENTKFKILVNLNGFKAQNFDAHKKFRVIIPSVLADYGWYVGYLRMFPEAAITIRSANNIYCISAAHVHHDESKISNYAQNYTMKNEGFFTDAQQARAWIDAIKVD